MLYPMNKNSGFTIIEAMVGVVISALIIAAISLFFTRGIAVNRKTYEQVLITEEARLQIDRVADVLRNARNNGAEKWLVLAGDNELVVYSNTDDDDDNEKVRFVLENEDLKRGVAEIGEEERIQTVASHMRNAGEGRPVFTYYNKSGGLLPAEGASAATIQRIGIALLVDVNKEQSPGVTEISTIVTPRVTLDFPSTRARLWPLSLTYPDHNGASQAVQATLTNPATGSKEEWWPYVVDLNDGRLATYDGHYYVNINYQTITVGSFLPGWYAWVGPIKVGQSGEQSYYETDQIPIDQVCQGKNLDELLTSCQPRTVSRGTLAVRYKPITIHTWPPKEGFADYVRDISFASASLVTPTPNPTPCPAATSTPTAISTSAPGIASGPFNPSANFDTTSAGTFSITNKANAYASDNIRTSNSVGGQSYYGVWTGFGITSSNVPNTATIEGILFEIEALRDGPNAGQLTSVKAVKGGSIVGDEKGAIILTQTDAYYNAGGSSDLHCTTWSSSDVQNSGFGVAISGSGTVQGKAAIDHIRATVYYSQ